MNGKKDIFEGSSRLENFIKCRRKSYSHSLNMNIACVQSILSKITRKERKIYVQETHTFKE